MTDRFLYGRPGTLCVLCSLVHEGAGKRHLDALLFDAGVHPPEVLAELVPAGWIGRAVAYLVAQAIKRVMEKRGGRA